MVLISLSDRRRTANCKLLHKTARTKHIITMTRKSKQPGGHNPLTYAETKRLKSSGYGTQSTRLTSQSMLPFGHCCLSLSQVSPKNCFFGSVCPLFLFASNYSRHCTTDRRRRCSNTIRSYLFQGNYRSILTNKKSRIKRAKGRV